MNKVLKGLVAVAATAAMAVAGFAGASTAMAAQAAGGTTKLTIKGADKGDQFDVYRLLNSTGSKDDAIAYYLRTDVRDAAPADAGTGNAAQVTSALETAAGVDSQASIESKTSTVVNFLNAKANGNSTEADHSKFGDLDSWAKSFYTTSLKTVTADYSATANEQGEASVVTIQQGYYLIVQKSAATGEAYSLNLVNTADASTNGLIVNLKRDVPELVKKVQDVNDSTGDKSDWIDSADYDVNDKVPFQLTGTVAKNVAAYDTYKYVFHDELSAGLTLNNTSIKVYLDSDDAANEIQGYTFNQVGQEFTVSFNDLKKATKGGEQITLTSSSKIIVEYIAELNNNAVIGSKGNPNTAYLEYANNPNASGEGDNNTTNTPEDKVIVFTYEVDVDKVNADGSKNLAGAEFKLEKWNKANNKWEEVSTIAATANGEKFTSKFQRVDDGKYRLTETKAPQGYTPIEPKEFEITATHDENASDPKLTKLELTGLADETITNTTGIADVSIKNTKGSELPSTGGMGTVMLYVAGIAVFVLAGATLVMALRRRNA